jgi:hypothetical protein
VVCSYQKKVHKPADASAYWREPHGLAAAFVANQHPGSFHRIISQSGSFWRNDCWVVKEFPRLEKKILVEFYSDVGTQEVHENVRHRENDLRVVSPIESVRPTGSGQCGTILGVGRRSQRRVLKQNLSR